MLDEKNGALVSIIAPINYLSLCVYNNFHYCYAEFLDNPIYKEFYCEAGKPVILDSSPSLPRSDGSLSLLLALDMFSPSLVVIPSIDFAMERSITIAEDFLRKSKGRVRNYLGVLQGTSIEELEKSYSFLSSHCSIIGLSCSLESIASRDEIARDLGIKESYLFLEVFSNPLKEVPTVGKAAGVCTSLPIRLAQEGRKIEEYRPTPKPLDFYSKNLLKELARTNILDYIETLEGEVRRLKVS